MMKKEKNEEQEKIRNIGEWHPERRRICMANSTSLKTHKKQSSWVWLTRSMLLEMVVLVDLISYWSYDLVIEFDLTTSNLLNLK